MIRNYALIEDEPPARSRLKRLMEELRPGAVCTAEAEDGESALQWLKQLRVDLLFLDIEFPPEGAFGFLRKAKAAGLHLPPILFATAYDQYALEAFRWAAWDYLLKPLNRERLKEALERVESRLQPSPALENLLQALDASKKQEAPSRFTVLHKGRFKVFPWSEVSHITSENRLVLVHTPEGHFVLDRTLDELEKLLSPRFVRCHRSALVDLARVRELVPETGGFGELRLNQDQRVPVSRDRMAEIKRLLG